MSAVKYNKTAPINNAVSMIDRNLKNLSMLSSIELNLLIYTENKRKENSWLACGVVFSPEICSQRIDISCIDFIPPIINLYK